MYKDERISYIVLCVAMLLFLFWIIPNQIKAPESATVSPRLIPQLCGAAIFVLALYKWISTMRLPDQGTLITLANYRLLGLSLVLLTVVTVLMNWIGFWIGCGIIMVGAMQLAGARDWRWIALFCVGLVAGSWYLLGLANIVIR